MNAADWIILAVIAVSVAQSAMEGFFHEAFGLAGLVFGYILAAWRYQRVADWLAPHVKSPWLGDIAGFLIIFLAVVIVAGILGRLARWAVKEVGLSFFDRMLGAALGLVRGALMVAIVLLGMTAFTPTSRSLEGSALAPYFQVIGRAAIWVAPSALRARFYEGLDLLRRERNVPAAPEGQPATH
jgi:membrane protein required for colicin V production